MKQNENQESKQINDNIINENIIMDNEMYKVEVAKDFTIPTLSNHIIDVNNTLTGYTAGLITRDLVSKGEEIVQNEYLKKHNPKTE